jgi:DNA-binding FadR family transcriptional regulator
VTPSGQRVARAVAEPGRPWNDGSRTTRSEAMAAQIEQRIADQQLAAGAWLGTKGALRDEFRVAAATCNEAVRLLEARGLVQARPGPGGGLFVTRPAPRIRLERLVLGFRADGAPFTDCLAVRDALEPLVCQEAARRCSAADAAELEAIVDAMAAAARWPQEFLRLNWQLHRRLAAIGLNEALRSLYMTLMDYVEDGIEEVQSEPGFDADASVAVHRRLVEAVVGGDRQRLDAALAAHAPSSAHGIGAA